MILVKGAVRHSDTDKTTTLNEKVIRCRAYFLNRNPRHYDSLLI